MAVAIGAASLVQPELVAGEVTLIGKMAADSAKKSITTIASDTGSKVVKGISKDIADDAKEEQAKDVAAKATKEKADGVENGKGVTPDISDPKAGTVETPKDGPNANVSSPSDAKATPAEDAAPKDKTIAIEVAQGPSKVSSNGDGLESKADSPAAAPVSLRIILGADGEVKAVTQGSVEKSSSTEPVTAVEPANSKIMSVQTTTKTAIVSTELPKEKEGVAPETGSTIPQPAPVPEKTPGTVQETPQAIDNTQKEKDGVVAETATPEPQPKASSEKDPEAIQAVPQTINDTPKASSPAIVSAVATVKTTNKISKTTTEEPLATESPKMVTVSQESLDLLHQSKSFYVTQSRCSNIRTELDTMHEAIQHITKVLAFHMPTPPSGPSGSSAIENVEEIITEALATAVKPLTDLVPQIMPKNDDSTHPPLEDPSTPRSSPKRPTTEKWTSVLGSIEKVFWPFGSSEKVATVTVTEVSSDQAEVAV